LIKKEIILLSIPLILASFTHLWNVDGFPPFHLDEGHYMRRTMQVLEGLGPQESKATYDNRYDHPYFGQILLGNLLKLSGYPDFAIAQTIPSIELAMAFPRMVMGIFAIIDTFLVFKISQRAYNTSIALFASILFAVTPMTWLTRMITLDNIGLPFLLTSILVSLNIVTWNKPGNLSKHIFLVLLSGTCLGLAIFTKIPFFTIIPLQTYLIYKNSKHLKRREPLEMIIIWLIPIILIPSIWPLYAIYADEFDLWQEGVLRQISRERLQIIEVFFKIDTILLFLGLAGLIYSVLRRDWILLLWIVPFLIFVYTHGWFNYFHWVMVFPAFCIAGAKFVIEFIQRVKSDRIKKSMVLVIVCSIISGIGFFNTLILINNNLESGAIKAIAESLDYSDKADGLDDDKINEKITVIAHTPYSWIYKHIQNMDYAFDNHRQIGSKKIETNKTLVLYYADIIDEIKNKFSSFVLGIGKLRKICNLDIEWYKKSDFLSNSPLVVTPLEHYNSSNNPIFTHMSHNKTDNPERIDMKNTTARYINITLLPNTDYRIGAISNMTIYGKEEANDHDCKKIPIDTIRFSNSSLYFRTLDNYDIISSYQKFLNEDKKKILEYEMEKPNLNGFTKLISGFEFPTTNITLISNY
jgi:Dolichyl-phosphate-mannose-protein mannosyltransferase